MISIAHYRLAFVRLEIVWNGIPIGDDCVSSIMTTELSSLLTKNFFFDFRSNDEHSCCETHEITKTTQEQFLLINSIRVFKFSFPIAKSAMQTFFSRLRISSFGSGSKIFASICEILLSSRLMNSKSGL